MNGLEVVVAGQGGAHLVDAVLAGVEHDHSEGAVVVAGGEQTVHQRLAVAHRTVDKDQLGGGGGWLVGGGCRLIAGRGRFEAGRGRCRRRGGCAGVDQGGGVTGGGRFDWHWGDILRFAGLVEVGGNGLGHGVEGVRGRGLGRAVRSRQRRVGAGVGKEGGVSGRRRFNSGRGGCHRRFGLNQFRGGGGGGRLSRLILGGGLGCRFGGVRGRRLVDAVRGRLLGGRDRRFLFNALFHGHAGEGLGRVRGKEQTGFQFLEEERILPGFSAGACVHAVHCLGKTKRFSEWRPADSCRWQPPASGARFGDRPLPWLG